MAASASRKTRTSENGRHPILGYKQKANTTLYKGTMAMHVNGVWEPCDSGVASSVYGGFAEDTYVNDTGSTKTYTTPMVFKRIPAAFNGKSGDLPTATDLGTMIAVEDDDTVKATTASNDVEVRLLSIEGNQFWVEPA